MVPLFGGYGLRYLCRGYPVAAVAPALVAVVTL